MKKENVPKVTPPSSASVLFQKTMHLPFGRFGCSGTTSVVGSLGLGAPRPVAASLPLQVTVANVPGVGTMFETKVIVSCDGAMASTCLSEGFELAYEACAEARCTCAAAPARPRATTAMAEARAVTRACVKNFTKLSLLMAKSDLN